MEEGNKFELDPSGRVSFNTKCPNGHPVAPRYRPEDWVSGLEMKTLRFHCMVCDKSWAPLEKDRGIILDKLKK
jgi:hypothetical protein